jgi:hypothetical protein
MGTGSFPGVKSGWGVTLAPHPLLVLWSRKGRAIPLLPLWAVGLYRASVLVQKCTLPLPLPRQNALRKQRKIHKIQCHTSTRFYGQHYPFILSSSMQTFAQFALLVLGRILSFGEEQDNHTAIDNAIVKM